jgi:hypothetical protein
MCYRPRKMNCFSAREETNVVLFFDEAEVRCLEKVMRSKMQTTATQTLKLVILFKEWQNTMVLLSLL